MYAYVQFLVDKVKAIVPVKDINDFDGQTFDKDSSRAYKVFWKSRNNKEGTGYWYAVVLLVEESQELIEQRKRRIKLPSHKILDDLLAMSLDTETKNSVTDEERRKNKELQEKRVICGKKKLKEILHEKLKEKKRSSLQPEEDGGFMASTPKRIRRGSPSLSESSDGDDLVLKSEFIMIKKEHEKVLHKLKLKKEENIKLKKKNDGLHELNASLQTQLLSLLKANGNSGQNPPPTQSFNMSNSVMKNLPKERVEGGSLLEQTAPLQGEPVTLPTDNCDQERVGISNAEINSKATLKENSSTTFELQDGIYLHQSDTLMKWIDEQMELAPGVFVRKDQWLNIVQGKNLNESRFTRNLAVTLWGSDTLLERSVTGAVCRRFKNTGGGAKKALTPIKVDAVQNGLRFWLHQQGKTRDEILKLSSLTSLRKMLSDKIMDLAKQKKKNLSQSFTEIK